MVVGLLEAVLIYFITRESKSKNNREHQII